MKEGDRNWKLLSKPTPSQSKSTNHKEKWGLFIKQG